ncbi:RecF/RecN/SMC N terminal domain-containing protein [Copromyces sp. CBS 386.78]|nr:RecF/RecN/SMC N terminal domain-containing protein [Copromyces sp. CBS 386.78]
MSTRPSRRAAATRRAPIIEESSSDDEIANTSKAAEDDEEEDYTPAPASAARKTAQRSTRRSTATPAPRAGTPAAPSSSTAPTSAPKAAPKRRGRPKKNAAPKPSEEPSAEPNMVAHVEPEAAPGTPEPALKPKDEPMEESIDPNGTVASAVSPATNAMIAEPEARDTQEIQSPPRKRRTLVRRLSRSPAKIMQDQLELQQQQASRQGTPTPGSPSAQRVDRQPAPLQDITQTRINLPPPATAASETLVNTQPASTADETVVAAQKPVRAMDTILEKPMDIVLKSRTMALPVVEDAGPKPRIVITNLVLINFKSYAGRQEVGPFHASFSSVVGPNGSGKSNVIDSLLFVFGFRASKMRQGKISALIHNSAQFPDLSYCEVEVHFQEVMDMPGGGHEVIPDSTLIISRKAFKNNSSQYYINGKSSNFTTVTTLLRDRGVDLDHKRFLILQGEVESIAQMKAKAGNEHEDGLLEYLEDIIGTSKYKTPIEESATEVETLNEICMEKSGRVQHVEKERNSLEDKKNKALAFVRDENELALKQSALYQLYISECDDNIAVTEEAIGQMQAQLDAELEKHHGSEQLIKQLEKAYSKGSKEYDSWEKQTQQLVKEMNKFEQERVKFEEKRKFLTDKRKKLEKTIANAEKTTVEAEETIQNCTKEIERRQKDIVFLEKKVKEEEAELATIRESLKGKTQKYSDQIAAKQKSLEPWKDKINQKQSAIAVAESELAILREKANAGTVALEEMEAKIVAIQERQAAKAEEMEQCKAERANLIKEGKKIEAELAKLAEEEPKYRQQLSNARQKADEARSSLSATQNRGNVLTALMRMKESGRIDGFHGRLGNLGAIDQKYDIAISTACGALDNFVTDTVEAGQQCIEYLRKTNLGRGNFMCLDKLRVRDMSPIQTPENAPRLFDLVKPKDDKFRPAFYHALQDTLVAKDLAQANRIAYGAKRWRVVTLAGELIDKSGTMTGGGTTVKRGLMSSKLVADTTKEQVDKLEQDRDTLEQAFNEFQDRQRELESRLRQVQSMVPQLETKMQKINLEVESSERNLTDAQRRIKELSKEQQPSKTDDNRVAALEKEIAKLKGEVEKLREEMSSVEDEIKALQDKIMKVGGEKLRSQKAAVDSLKAEIATQNEETNAAEVKMAKAEKQKHKLEKDFNKASKELQNAIQETEALEEEIQNQGDTAESLTTRVEEAQEALKEKKKELAAMKKELDEKTAELNETRAVEIEMRNKLEENQKILSENQKRLRYWEDKLSKLVLQDIEDLERGTSADAVTAPQGPADPDAMDVDDPDSILQAQLEAEAAEAEEDKEDEEEEEEEEEEDAMSLDENDEEPRQRRNKTPKKQKQKKRRQQTGKTPRKPRNPLELPRYTRDELADMSKEKLKGEIAALEEKISNVNIDLSVLSEYRRRVEEHLARSSDLASAVSQRDAAKKRLDELRRLRLEGFMEGFSTISLRLKEMYQMITMGGNAELELVDSLDPFSEGILFSVMPPKKSWKNISNLSGGEKTLSSLALVFALHHYKPTPLYVMDEIDAALDFRNVSIVASYIKERTKNAQFIVISLRNNMFELAARLVGVYKVNHMTKSVTIENHDYIQRGKHQKEEKERRERERREREERERKEAMERQREAMERTAELTIASIEA